MDRRLEILAKEGARFPLGFPPEMKSAFYNAMDEYFTERVLELLEYMAKNDIKCTWYEHECKGIVYSFHFKGECISKEQLFENFL